MPVKDRKTARLAVVMVASSKEQNDVEESYKLGVNLNWSEGALRQ